MTRVGMREFRTHLSAIVRRVRDNGETFEITRRGKPVAILRPMKPWEKELAKLDNRASERNVDEWIPWSDEMKVQRLPDDSHDNSAIDDHERQAPSIDGSDAERTTVS